MEAGLFQYPTEVINLEAVLLDLQKTQTQNSRALCEEGLQSMAVGRRQVSLQKAQKMQPLLQSCAGSVRAPLHSLALQRPTAAPDQPAAGIAAGQQK